MKFFKNKKYKFLSVILSAYLVVIPQLSHSALPVVDVASIAQLIQQIKHMLEVIKQLDSLNDWQKIDHTNLAGGKFRKFLSKYRQTFDDIINEVEGYQNGGLLGQIERLDEIYFPYYDDWENTDKEDDFTTKAHEKHRALKKQILWTRIQLKHSAKVASKIRDSIPIQEEQIQILLDDTAQAVGLMQSVKIGNQINGMMAKSLQSLNLQLTEVIQENSASGLEKNHKEGLQKNRQREALEGFGDPRVNSEIAPLNPIRGF